MPQGTVKWFVEDKGYGFINPDAGGKDVFVHHTALDGNRALPAGARVEFEVVEGRRGPLALRVRVM